MNLIVNGKEETVYENLSLLDYIKQKELDVKRIIIEYNFQIIPAETWADVPLKDNDKLEILSIVGGG